MPPRRKKAKRRSSPKTVSLWNLGVGWVYLTGLSKIAFNSGPVEFILGAGDLAEKTLADDGSTDLWLDAYRS